MRVEIWSDVVCPWCYVGKRRFEAALRDFPAAGEVEVRWRSFELDPAAPRQREGTLDDHVARKYGLTPEQAHAAQARLVGLGAEVGIEFRFDIAHPGNTFDAHRLLHLAANHGLQDATKERLFVAYFSEGAPIGDHETLVRLTGEVGLDPNEVRVVLAGDAYADAVRADERAAAELGVSGVPFFVIDRELAVSGAQSSEVFRDVLDEAWRALTA